MRRAFPGGLLLLLLLAPVYFYRLGGPGLGDPDEGRNAEVAREMLAGGDWVTPHLNDTVYLDKPPAYFWTVAASLRLFGVNETGARLPSALFAMGGAVLVFWFARRHFGTGAGLLAGLALGLSPLYMVFGRLVIFDMMLTLCISVSVMAAFEAMEGDRGRRRAWGAVCFAAMGVGTLVKGPVALALPLLIAVIWVALRRRPGMLLGLCWGQGALIYAAIVLPWLAMVETRNPGFIAYAVLGENLARMTSDRFDTARPVYFYLKVILPGLFPWVVFCAVAAGRRLIRRKRPEAAVSRPALYAALWLGVTLLFFSLVASKRPSYVLPCAVPVAVLSGYLFAAAGPRRHAGPVATPADAEDAGEAEGEARADLAAGAIGVAVTCALLAVGAILAGPVGLLRGMSLGSHDTLLARTGLFALTAAGAALAGVVLLLARRANRPAVLFAVALAPIAAMLPLARAVADHVGGARSSRGVSEFLAERLRPGDKVICYIKYRPGVNFYLRRPIYQVREQGRIFTSNYIKEHVDRFRGRPSFRLVPQEDFRAAILDDGAAEFVLASRRDYDDLDALELPLQRVYEDGGGRVFVKRTGEN